MTLTRLNKEGNKEAASKLVDARKAHLNNS